MPEAAQRASRFITDSMVSHAIIIRFLMFAFVAIGTSMIGALTGADWSMASQQTRLLIIMSILVNGLNTIGAFMDRSIDRYRRGLDLYEGNPNPFSQPTPTTASSAQPPQT